MMEQKELSDLLVNGHRENKIILDNGYFYYKPQKRIKCNDGFEMSVQVGDGNYCNPRKDNSDFYLEAEVGYPSEKEELLMPYIEDESSPTKTVYGYVPLDVIVDVINKHGGI